LGFSNNNDWRLLIARFAIAFQRRAEFLSLQLAVGVEHGNWLPL